MKTEKAAGPKTELIGVSSRMQQSIEEMIASVSRGIGDCMDNARNAEPQSLADDTRSSERRDAVQMMSSTAELLSSIGKLKGEFQHSYHIVRDASAEERALREEKKREVSLMKTQREVEEMSDEQYIDYHRAMKGLPPKFKKTWHAMDRTALALDDRQLGELEAEVARGEDTATTPLPRNAGSNTDAGKS
ncbi:MAG TPA: hypothetical protein VHE09_07010 [Rhizomicrobium sp.]|jgi:hypothetical protein|nr:hypothetical protein [Rhizomicrobium sp.]